MITRLARVTTFAFIGIALSSPDVCSLVEAQTTPVRDLLEAPTSEPARAYFQKRTSIKPIWLAWQGLSPRGRLRALRIAKLHRDGESRAHILRLAALDSSDDVRTECVRVAISTQDFEVLLKAGSARDPIGGRAIRAFAKLAPTPMLTRLVPEQHEALQRKALNHAVAIAYWRLVDDGADRNTLRGFALPEDGDGAGSRVSLALVADIAAQRPTASDPGALVEVARDDYFQQIEAAVALEQSELDPGFFEQKYRLIGLLRQSRSVSAPSTRWLKRQLHDPLWMLREGALQALFTLEQLQPTDVLPLAETDPSPRVRAAAVHALTAPSQVETVLRLARSDPWPIVRVAGTENLAGRARYRDVAERLKDRARRVRAAALDNLAEAPQPLALEATEKILDKSKEWPKVKLAALSLLRSRCLPLRAALGEFLLREDKLALGGTTLAEDTVPAALRAHFELAGAKATDALQGSLRSPVARAALRRLRTNPPERTCSSDTAR